MINSIIFVACIEA